MIIISLARIYINNFPGIRRKLKVAHMKDSAEAFVNRAIKSAATLAVLLSVIGFFFLSAFGKSPALLLVVVPGCFIFFFWFMMHTPDVYIRRRDHEIEREVLFAGRFILVKIEAGEPFFNALIDASKTKGMAGKYFKEIVDDINLGTPIEKALDNAVEYSPSDKFRRILWQINNSLKTGIDVADTLKSILHQITQEQIISIKEYGKKLNSLAMFYMLIGIVVPALGVTMFIIISSFLELKLEFKYLLFVVFMIMCLQFLFMSMFKTIRPPVTV